MIQCLHSLKQAIKSRNTKEQNLASFVIGEFMEQRYFLSYKSSIDTARRKHPETPIVSLSEEILHHKTKEEGKKLSEKLEAITDEIIKLYYEMEQSILLQESIPEERYIKLKSLKELNSVYKKSLSYNEPEKVNLPLSFIEEYSDLRIRAENIISKTIQHLEMLNGLEGATLFVDESKKRIEVLTMLSSHYKRALELE